MSASITSPRRLRDARGETCGGCPLFAPLLEPGRKPADYGPCVVDGEYVSADCPQCSNAPLSHGGTRCGEIGGDDGTTSAD